MNSYITKSYSSTVGRTYYNFELNFKVHERIGKSAFAPFKNEEGGEFKFNDSHIEMRDKLISIFDLEKVNRTPIWVKNFIND